MSPMPHQRGQEDDVGMWILRRGQVEVIIGFELQHMQRNVVHELQTQLVPPFPYVRQTPEGKGWTKEVEKGDILC